MRYSVSVQDSADDRGWRPVASGVNKILAVRHIQELVGQGFDTDVTIMIADDNARPGYDEVEYCTLVAELYREATESGWDLQQLEFPTAWASPRERRERLAPPDLLPDIKIEEPLPLFPIP